MTTLDVAERAPTSAISERALEYGYRRVGVRERGPALGVSRAVVEACSCGEPIITVSRSQRDVALAIRAHNLSTAHRQWRAARAVAGEAAELLGQQEGG